MPSLKHFKHIHFMLWSLIVGEIKSIMLKVWKIKSRNRSSRPEAFLEILQNSQENPCARVSFIIKLPASGHVFSCEFCKISKNTFSYSTPPVAVSDAMQYLVYLHEIVAVDNHHAIFHFLWPQV